MKPAQKAKLKSRSGKGCKVCGLDAVYRGHISGRLAEGASLRAIASEMNNVSRRQLKEHLPHVGRIGGDAA